MTDTPRDEPTADESTTDGEPSAPDWQWTLVAGGGETYELTAYSEQSKIELRLARSDLRFLRDAAAEYFDEEAPDHE